MDLLNAMVQPDMSALDVDLIYSFTVHIGYAESVREAGELKPPQSKIVSLALPAMFNIPGSVQFYAVTEKSGWHAMNFNYIVFPGERIDVIIDLPGLFEIKAVVKRLL